MRRTTLMRFASLARRARSGRSGSNRGRSAFRWDAVLEIADAGGKLLVEVDDTSNQRDPVLNFTVPGDGEYELRVRDLHGRGGMLYAYRLTAAQQSPGFALSLASGEFVLTGEESLAIPVTVARDKGFEGEIKIAAVDLPAGVTVEEVSSKPQGDSAKKVTLKLVASDKAANGSFRILGRGANESALAVVARFSIADQNATHDLAWVTVSESSK